MDKLGLPLEYLEAAAMPLDESLPMLRPDDKLAKNGSVAGQSLSSSGTAHLKFSSGLQYSGDVVNGLREGRGTLILEDGTRYSGTFAANLPHGQGTISYADGSEYRGDIVYGVRHGHGSFTLAGASAQYIGDWYQGQRHGTGTLWYGPERSAQRASFYKGQWSADKRHGRGMLRYSSGNVYVGQWVADSKQGLGRMSWLDSQEEAVGYWLADALHGEAVHTWYAPPPSSPGGHVSQASPFAGCSVRNRYVGQFSGGYRSGQGTFLYANGSRYTGEWYGDMKHGHGLWVGAEGTVYQGLFLEDRVMLTAELLALQQAAEGQAERDRGNNGRRAGSRQCLGLTQQPEPHPRGSITSSSAAAGADGGGKEAEAASSSSLRAHDLLPTTTAAHAAPSAHERAAAASVRATVPPPSSASASSSGDGAVPAALQSAYLSTLSGSPTSSSSSSSAVPQVSSVNGDAPFTADLHDLLPSPAAMADWYLRSHPGRASEGQGQGGRVDEGNVHALGAALHARAHAGVLKVLLRWNSRMLGWYTAYSRCAAPAPVEAGGAHACAGYTGAAAYIPPTHSAALSDPAALRLQFLALRSGGGLEPGCASAATPVLRLSQLWRLLQDCGVLHPPDVCQSRVGELLVEIRRRATRRIILSALRLAYLSSVQSARVAALEYAQGPSPSAGEGQGEGEGGTGSGSGDSSEPLLARAPRSVPSADRGGRGGRGYEEEKKEQQHTEGAGQGQAPPPPTAAAGPLTQAQLMERIPGALPLPVTAAGAGIAGVGGLVLPPETAQAVRYIISQETGRLSLLARAAQDPDAHLLYHEFVEVLARLAVERYRASGGQLAPTALPGAGVGQGGGLGSGVTQGGTAQPEAVGGGGGTTSSGTAASAAGSAQRYARAAAATNSLLALSQGPVALATRLGLALPGTGGPDDDGHGVTGMLEHHAGLLSPPPPPLQQEGGESGGPPVDEAHPDLLPLVVEAFLWCGVQPHALSVPAGAPVHQGRTVSTSSEQAPSLEKTLNLLPSSAVQQPPLKGSKARAPREPPLVLPPAAPLPQPLTHQDGLRLAVHATTPVSSDRGSAAAAGPGDDRVQALCTSARALLVGPTGSLLGELFSCLSSLSLPSGPRVLPVGEVLDLYARQQAQQQGVRPSSAGRRRSLPSPPVSTPQAQGEAEAEGPGDALADKEGLLGPEVRAALAVASAILPIGPLPCAPPLHAVTGPALLPEQGKEEGERAGRDAARGPPPPPPGGILQLASRPEAPGHAEALSLAREGACGAVRAGLVLEALTAGGLVDAQRVGRVAEEEAIAAAVAAGLAAAPLTWPAAAGAHGTATTTTTATASTGSVGSLPHPASPTPAPAPATTSGGGGGKPGTAPAASRPPSASGPPKTASSSKPPQTSGGPPPPTASGKDKNADRRTPAELAAEAAADPQRVAAARLFLAQSAQMQGARDRIAALVNEHTLPTFTAADVLSQLMITLSPAGAAPAPAGAETDGAGGREALLDVTLTKPEFAELTLRLSVALARAHCGRTLETVRLLFSALSSPSTPSAPMPGSSGGGGQPAPLVAASFRTDLDAEAQRFFKKQQAAAPPSGPGSEASGLLGSDGGGSTVLSVDAPPPPAAAPAPPAATGKAAGKAPPTPTPSKLAQHAAGMGKRIGALNLFSTGPSGTVDPSLLAYTVEEGDREVKRLLAAALGRLMLVATGPAEAGRKRTAAGTAGIPFPVATLLSSAVTSDQEVQGEGDAPDRESKALQLPTDIGDVPLQAMSVPQLEAVLEVTLPLILGSLQATAQGSAAV